MADIPSLEIGNSRDLAEVRAEVHRLVGLIAPGHDLGLIDAAFALMDAACEGRLDGFLPLATPYHDQAHLMEVVLCSARLLHGLFLAGRPIEALTIDACLIGALLHDSGYLIRRAEVAAWPGSGAQFTLTHVVRGVVFAETQLGQVLPPALMSALAKVILTTDHRPVAAPLHYDSSAERLAAQVTATADLIGQMSSREYLERLLLLYYEFKEAGIGSFAGSHDLLEKTDGFYRLMAVRLQRELGGLTPYLAHHFAASRRQARNYYAESVERNIDHLQRLVQVERRRRFEQLRRGGIVERALTLLGEEPL